MKETNTDTILALVSALGDEITEFYIQEAEEDDSNCYHIRYVKVILIENDTLPHERQYEVVKGCSCNRAEPRQYFETGQDSLIQRLKHITHTWRKILIHESTEKSVLA